VKNEGGVFLVDGSLKESRANEGLFFWLYGVLRGRLPPVFVDAVLEMEDCQISDILWQRLVQKDGLGGTSVRTAIAGRRKIYDLPEEKRGSSRGCTKL